MKKIYLALVLALMFMLSISVNAEAGYAPSTNSYTSSITDGAKTVVIYKGTAESVLKTENIYYIDQCADAAGFSNLNMLMKLGAPAGTYTVATNKGTTTFEISKAEAFVSGSTKMEFLGAEKQYDSLYSVAFGFRASLSVINASATLAMVIDENAYTTDLCGENSIINWDKGYVYNDGEELMLAIQIDNIGEEYMTKIGEEAVPNFQLYIK